MNCKEAHLLIASLNGDVTPPALAAHVEICPACAELLAADARLRAALRSQPVAASPYVLGRIRQEIAEPARRPWFESLLGKKTMKITLPVAAAAALLAAFSSLPRSADARTPREAFELMRQAVAATTGGVTPLEFGTMKRPDGSTAMVLRVNGRDIALGRDGTFSWQSHGKTFNVRTGVAPNGDISTLPPAQREAARLIEEVSRRTGRPMTDFVVRDGKVVSRQEADAWNRKQGIEIRFRMDLNAARYRSMAFGEDRNHLVLVPNAPDGGRYLVTLDPTTHLPKTVLLQKNRNGFWVESPSK